MQLEKSTPAQNSTIGYLISRLRLDPDTKEELIYTHTDGRTTSIRALYKHEAIKVIQSLTSGESAPQSPANKMRRKVLSMAHELGWKIPDGKIDMERINAWCNKYGHVKRNLDKYTENELPELVTQFERAYFTHIKNV
nr:hypothetical protein [Mucilaginibacter sp. L294]